MSYSVQQIGVTGPKGRIGSGTEYHIDTKYNRSLPFEDIVSRFDAKAAAYSKDGRNIVFSNQGVHGSVYDPSASLEDKVALLKRADAAHSHSVHDDFYSFDYYAPIGKDLWDKSAEGAPIYLSGKAGRSAKGGTGGGYGNYAYVEDDQGTVLGKSGHGDINHDVFAGGTFGEGETNLSVESTPQQEAKERTQNWADMSKEQLNAEYDKIRNTPGAATTGMAMHKAFFGKK